MSELLSERIVVVRVPYGQTNGCQNHMGKLVATKMTFSGA